MKIGVLTFHRSINYGALMQCYSLVRKLQSRFPNDDIEVIDYTPQFRINLYKPNLRRIVLSNTNKECTFLENLLMAGSMCKKILLNPSYVKQIKTRYMAFKRSLECIPLSKESYRQNNCEDFRKEVYGRYDIIIVGSDQIWSWNKIDFPNAYFLYGDYHAHKMSYAASSATDSIDRLSKEQKVGIKNALTDFSYIGVRDTATEYVVSTLCPTAQYHHNCDPTTFLNLELLNDERHRMSELLKSNHIKGDKPIVGIMGGKELGKLVRYIFGNSVDCVGLYYPNEYCDVNLFDISVLEWASLFGLFNLTLTNFFHGTMLSLVHGIPVLSFDILKENEKQITKLHELYTRLDLPDFYHKGSELEDEKQVLRIKSIAENLIRNPDSERIKQEIKKEAQSSENFFDALDLIIEHIKEKQK